MKIKKILKVYDKIKICPRCVGKGFVMEEDLMDIYDAPDEPEYRVTCGLCDGSGKVQKAKVVCKTYVAYKSVDK